jgi:RsiW-degrading membrane proteinase PrsW (M82 family)
MNPTQIGIPLLIAAGIPLLFLILAYSLDLYSTHSLRLVVMAFLWGGIIGLGLAYSVNTHLTQPLLTFFNLHYILLYLLFAPIVEELIKMVPLAYYMHHGQLTFFMDGAIYGFAAGIGFSIGETFIYINQYPELAIPLAVARAFSTSLMHGAAAALIGVAYGLARLRRYRSRKGLVTFAWVIAVIFHSLFNALAISGQQPLLAILGAMLIGIGSFELLLMCIRLGLKEEKLWLEETLDPHLARSLMGMLTPVEQQLITDALEGKGLMSIAEIRATQGYEDLDRLLTPLREQFPKQANKMEQIIFQQAQMGIKRRLIWEIDDPKVQERLQAQIATLDTTTQRLRQEVGSSALAYLNCVFDDVAKPMQACVDTVASSAAVGEEQPQGQEQHSMQKRPA